MIITQKSNDLTLSGATEGRARPSVCIISHKAYGAFCGGNSGHIGGIEWQTSLTARWLAQRGHETSMITWDEGGPETREINGVKLIKLCRQKAGVKGLRFFHPKWTSLIKALRQADAEVYYQNGAECTTGQVALWCGQNDRSFVFSTANDTDCDLHLPQLRTPWVRWLYRHGLRRADLRIVQTETQRAMLKSSFDLGSVVIPMPCPEPVQNEVEASTDGPAYRVVWIARVCRQKRPDRLLDLAAACPDIQFDMVGPFSSDDFCDGIRHRASQLGNVAVHGGVSRDKVAFFYQRAICLCCTSDYEGFPNTFLEAWSHGLPIVSTFDPDDLLAKRKLGLVAREVPALQAALHSLFNSPDLRVGIGRNARQYFFDHHRCEAVLPKFADAFAQVARRRHAGQTRHPGIN